MKNRVASLLILGFLNLASPALPALALSPEGAPRLDAIPSMECHVLVYSKDRSQRMDQTFRIENPGKGHESAERIFESGASRVAVGVNRQGLQLEWVREGIIRARAWSALQESQTKAMVLIVYDPVQEGDQASVDCTF